VLVLAASAFVLIGSSIAAAQTAVAATTQPAAGRAVIQGTVRSDGEVPLSEMVVYLESLDDGRQFPVPSDPVSVSQKGAQFSPALDGPSPSGNR
jgi:hypothetical protein